MGGRVGGEPEGALGGITKRRPLHKRGMASILARLRRPYAKLNQRSGSETPIRRNLLLLLVDVVSYSRLPSQEQLDVVNSLLGTWRSLQPVKRREDLRIPHGPISVGDGFIFWGIDSATTVDLLLRYVCTQARLQQELPTGDIPWYSTRFALHAGECWLLSNNVFGHPMNELARVSASALPGQVLVSNAFWERIEVHSDMSRQRLAYPPENLLYDEYWLRFKHDKWLASGCAISLPGGEVAKRGVRNVVVVEDREVTLSPIVGDRKVPGNAVRATTENNYHHRLEPDGVLYQLRSEEELFRLHCTERTSVLTVNTGSYFFRLPYERLFTASPMDPPFLIEAPDERTTPQDAQEKCFVTLSNLSERSSPSGTRLVLSVGKCAEQRLLWTNLSPDWHPSTGPSGRAVCLREALTASPGLPALDDGALANAVHVSAIVVSGDSRLVLSATSEPIGALDSGSLGLQASGFVDWRFVRPSVKLDEERGLVDDSQVSSLIWVGYERPSPRQRWTRESRDLPRKRARLPVSFDRAIVSILAQKAGLVSSAIQEIHLLGFLRSFSLLGLPELYYLVVAAPGYDDLRKRFDSTGFGTITTEAEEASLSIRGRRLQDWADQVRVSLFLGIPLRHHARAGLALLANYLRAAAREPEWTSVLRTYVRGRKRR
jgi:class 3 adenylate cyclase